MAPNLRQTSSDSIGIRNVNQPYTRGVLVVRTSSDQRVRLSGVLHVLQSSHKDIISLGFRSFRPLTPHSVLSFSLKCLLDSAPGGTCPDRDVTTAFRHNRNGNDGQPSEGGCRMGTLIDCEELPISRRPSRKTSQVTRVHSGLLIEVANGLLKDYFPLETGGC